MKRPKNSIFAVCSIKKDGSQKIKFYQRKPLFVSSYKTCGYLDLTPLTLPFNLKSAPTADKYRFNLQGKITVEISTDEKLLQTACVKLLGLKKEQIAVLVTDTVLSSMKLAIAAFDIENINLERQRFFSAISYEVEEGLKHLGMKAVNFSYTDMSDEDGYFIEYGREKMLKAIEQAKAEIEEAKKKYSPD